MSSSSDLVWPHIAATPAVSAKVTQDMTVHEPFHYTQLRLQLEVSTTPPLSGHVGVTLFWNLCPYCLAGGVSHH